MSAPPARGYLGISEVLAKLRADFPDISVSKIRFLETEGLIAPARSPAGYRRFCGQDVDRLRFILSAQRDQYLPLRVIKERLARLDQVAADPAAADPIAAVPSANKAGAGKAAGSAVPAWPAAPAVRAALPDHGTQGVRPDGLLSRRELLDVAGMTEALLTELETFGLLRRVGRHYGQDAVEVAKTAVALSAFGVEARHLRAVRAAAERESTMIESLLAPILRQRGAGARELAGRTARECALLVLRLHAALVGGALAEAGLGEPGPLAAGLTGQSAQIRGELPSGMTSDAAGKERMRQQARGAGGASA